jgi:glycosyltransferase involved in cell wall biosynthesis
MQHLTEAYEEPLIIYDMLDASVIIDLTDETISRLMPVPPVDRNLLNTADVVLAANQQLAKEYWAQRPDLIELCNGIVASRFHRPAQRPLDLPRDKPLIGCWGSVAASTNLQLLEIVARRRPDWMFFLVGEIEERLTDKVAMIGRSPNVRFLGVRKPELRPAYVQAMDVGVIWSVVNDQTMSITPPQIYEYLAAGKPCVSTPLPACMRESEVVTAGDPAAFVEALEKSLVAVSPAEVESRREVGRKADWAERFRPVADLLESARKLTII